MDLHAALTALAPALTSGGTGIEALTRLTGGASMETWAFDAVGSEGPTPLILRRMAPSAARDSIKPALGVEAALMQAAATTGVPVPQVVRVCGEEDGIGDAIVVARVAGETLGRRIAGDARFAPARERLAGQCGAALARIHAVPTGSLPPLDSRDAGAVLAYYEATWRSGGAVRPAIEAAFRWLGAQVPEPVPATLVHGDFRNGNIMVDAQSGLVAVLDWELAHLGDPAEDLGWLCVNSWRFGQPGKVVGGFGDLDALLEDYAAAGGVPVASPRVRFWQALGSLKWAVMTNMMFRSESNPDGTARSVERTVIGRRTSECEADLVALMEQGL